MNKSVRSVLFWTPRALWILFALFLVIFSFDVFGEGYGFWGTTAAFLIHNIPTVVLLLVLWLTWRREWIGGVITILVGIAYIVAAWGKFPLGVYFIIAGPLILIGILFLLNWLYRAELRPDAKQEARTATEEQA